MSLPVSQMEKLRPWLRGEPMKAHGLGKVYIQTPRQPCVVIICPLTMLGMTRGCRVVTATSILSLS